METQIPSGPLRGRPRPFRIALAESVLEDLGCRLGATRWPDEAPGHAPWQLGAELSEIRALAEYWRSTYDWRAQEASLNALPQFVVKLDGVQLHYIHAEGRGPRPVPLLLPHGWPSSVAEMQCIVPMLADPARFGVQGGDWGAFIATRLGHARPDVLLGIHLSLLAVPREVPTSAGASSCQEQQFYKELAAWLQEETGYIQIMGTKPQTLAYALHDSPVGLLAWIVEKWQRWTDCGGDVHGVIGRDNLLTNVMLYWATGAIGSSFWPYYARLHEPWIFPPGGTVPVPVGYAEFPKEFLRPPRSLAARTYTDIRRWTPMPRGGHFPAAKCPEALAGKIRAFFRPVRESLA